MIIRERKTIFVHIPKNAGTSIEKYFDMKLPLALLLLGIPHDGKHDTIDDIKSKFPEEYNSYAKFTIVRNPYDRMVSWYFHLKDKVERDGFDLEKDFTNFINWVEDPFKTRYTKWALTDPWQKDPNPIYFNPQHTYIDETVTVLKYENLNEELNEFFEEELDLPVINKFNHEHFSKYYDKRSSDVVYKKYKEDFERFNYKRIEEELPS